MARSHCGYIQQGDGQARHAQSAESGLQHTAQLSPDDGGTAVGGMLERRPQPHTGCQSARPRPLRHGEGEGAHPRIHRRTLAARRSQVAHPLPLRASGSGQDIAGQEHRLGLEAQVCAHVAGRSTRRSRDPRPSTHLRGGHARPHHQEHTEGGDIQSGVHPRRDRQGDAEHHQRRSVVGLARSARPGTEQCLPRQLSRCRLRPVESALRGHGQRPQHHSPAAARPHGSHRGERIHHRGEDGNSAAPPRAA